MTINPLHSDRLSAAKRSYTTRRVPRDDFVGLVEGEEAVPRAGDLVLARVEKLGHHTNLESPLGRRVKLFPGDEIIACYGNRYASAQFEAEVCDDLSQCNLVAGGGVVGRVVSAHAAAKAPSVVQPLGLVAGADGRPLNLRNFTAPKPAAVGDVPLFAVVGTSMSSGKTTVASHLVRGMVMAGLSVAAGKATGTGSGGDYWRLGDAGASPIFDFVDLGHASTAGLPPDEVREVFHALVDLISPSGIDAAVVEIADGLFQKETHALINSETFRNRVSGVIFAADSAVSAVAGVQWLTSRGVPMIGVSGLFTRSPLMINEARSWTEVPVLKPRTIASPDAGGELWRPVLENRSDKATA